MALPFTAGSSERPPGGSSIVNLIAPARPDERPTIIGPVPATSLVAGQTLGHFELLGPLGRGGMATVLKARDLELGRIVALKILPPETTGDAEAVSRFKQEARAAAKLDSDHIARVYFCGEDRGLHFIAFEFIPGDNLRVVMKDKLSPALAVRYLLHVAHGLKHASERGIVHRDIKPSNIIITPDGHAKIVDMGLARTVSLSAAGGVTQSGVTLGTFDYISPEQALDPRRADVRSDIYSLGCTFYHALTGVPPVPEGTAARKLQAHQKDAPIDPRDLNPLVPESLAAVLARMMAKDPEKRYPSAALLIDDLHAVAVTCGYAQEVPEGLSVKAAPTLDAARVPWPWIGAMAAIVAAVAIIVMRGSSPTNTQPPWNEDLTPSTAPNTVAGSNVRPAAANVITNVEQLVEALKQKAASVVLKGGMTFDLRTELDNVVVSDSTVMIEGDGSGVPPRLIVFGGESTTRSLQFRNCPAVTLRGLQIEVSHRNGDDGGLDDAGIGFENVGRAAIQGCIRADRDGLVAFVLAATGGELSVSNSCNIRSRLASNVKAEYRDCAFAGSAVQVKGESETPGECRFSNCTFLFEHAAIVVDERAAMKFSAGYCLFADQFSLPAEDDEPVPDQRMPGCVLKLYGENGESRFQAISGQPNAYFGVQPLWLGGFNFSNVPASKFSDPAGRVLVKSPWAVAKPMTLLDGSDPAAAFRLNLNDPRLRVSGAVILGAKTLGPGEGRIYPGPWPPERAQAIKAGANERVVWPDADGEERLYSTFTAAYAALQPGETLSLAVSGDVAVPNLPEKTLRATIAAKSGYKPVLVPDGPSFTNDAALVRLADGELTFENLEVKLKDRQAIVHMAAGTSCTFRKCVLTLSEKDDVPAAAVVIPDPAREMRMPVGSDDTPRVSFIDTIVRGEGQGVWVQAARGFEVAVENCGIALLGSWLRLDASERAGEPPRGKLSVKSSTLVLNESLIETRTSKGGILPSMSVEADASLFLAADTRSTACSLVMLEGVDPTAEISRHLQWSGRGSVYVFAEAAPAIEWRGSNDAMTASYDWPQWLKFARDDGKHVTKLRFAKGPLKAKVSSVEAADFALSVANPVDAGVDVEKLP